MRSTLSLSPFRGQTVGLSWYLYVSFSLCLCLCAMLFILFRYFMTHGIIVKLREFHIPLLAETATMTFCGLPSLHKSLRDSVKVFLSPVCQSDICAAIPNPVSIPELAYQVGKVRSGLTSDNTHCVLRSLEWGNALWTLKMLSFYGKLNLKN